MSILGYDINESTDNLINNNIYTGINPYDLRKNSYLYIYITNISDKAIATVNINTSKKGIYSMDVDKLNVNEFLLEIKDEANNLVDFCNLSFKLEFNLIFQNNDIKIDNDLEEKMIDSEESDVSSIDSPNLHNANELEI